MISQSPNPVPHHPIYDIAARVFHERGYDATSMEDIARAAGLTKAGLYHHIASKEKLLYTILDYGMDLTDQLVVQPVGRYTDPMERLKQMIERHLKLILQDRNHEVTVILHEDKSLKGPLRRKIDDRKKAYIHFVAGLVRDVLRQQMRIGASLPPGSDSGVVPPHSRRQVDSGVVPPHSRARVSGRKTLIPRLQPWDTVAANEQSPRRGRQTSSLSAGMSCRNVDSGVVPPHSKVDPLLAALALLGMINWCYQWYRPGGKITIPKLVSGITEIFLKGIV